jgi:hypothetical protein
MHFADAAIQPTPGDRGTTTRRKSTRTVCGAEGRWIASVKEELAKRPKTPAPAPRLGVIDTRYSVTCPHPLGQNVGESGVNNFWFADEAEARAKAASLPSAALARRETPERADIWLPLEHAPGFDPNGESCPMPVRQTLEVLAALSPGPALAWLREQRAVLEAAAGAPLARVGCSGTRAMVPHLEFIVVREFSAGLTFGVRVDFSQLDRLTDRPTPDTAA